MSGTENPDGELPGLLEVHLESADPIVKMIDGELKKAENFVIKIPGTAVGKLSGTLWILRGRDEGGFRVTMLQR